MRGIIVTRTRRRSWLAAGASALLAGVGLVAGTPSAQAVPVSLTVNYSCPFPLIGNQALSVTYEASDVPDSVTAGDPLDLGDITTTISFPPTVTQGMILVGARTIEGSAQTGFSAPGATPSPFTVTSPLPTTDVPASGGFSMTAQGTAPSLAVSSPGAVSVSTTDLRLTLTPKTAAGAETGLGTFDSACTLVPGQDTVLSTTTVTAAATAPDAPTAVTATAGPGSALVSWTPGNAGSNPITKYTVTASSATAPTLTRTVDGATTSTTVTGLTPGAEYTFRVVATNSTGDSPASAASNPATPYAAPGLIGSPPPATAGTAYSYTFATTGYPSPAVTIASGTLPPGLTLAPSGTLTGTPTTAGSFTFTVQADNGYAPTASLTSTITVSPGAPAAVTVSGGNAQSVTVGQPYPTALTAQVADEYGNPIPGAAVTFTVTSGSATFTGGSASATATTGPTGVATAPTLTAGTTAGPVTVTASSGAAGAATFTEAVTAAGPAVADLAISVSAPTSVSRGHTFPVKVTITNKGTSAASKTFTTVAVGRQLSITNPGGGTARSSAVIFSTPSLASGASTTYTVTLKAGTKKTTTGILAVTLSAVKDPSLRNNVAVTALRIT